MTHRESKAISDRINRKANSYEEYASVVGGCTLDELVYLQAMTARMASRKASEAAYYAKAIKLRKMEAKKLTGSGDDRRTRIAAGPETGGHVEASPTVDGVPTSSEHGCRRAGDNA